MLTEMPGEEKSRAAGRTAEEDQRPGKAVLGRYVARGGCGDSRAKSTLYDVLGTRFLQAQPLSSPQPLGLLLLIVWGNTQARVYQRSKRASEIVLESN
jgi:hypothetical protein